MKHAAILGMRVVAFLVCSLATILSVNAAPLTLVSWNLQWFPGRSPSASPADSAAHMAATQTALRAINPDILCLQEVRDWKAAHDLVSVLPGFSIAVVSAFPGKQQQVIATRLPIDSAWADQWHSRANLELPRGYAFAAIRLPNGITLLTYSLHTKANSNRDNAANIAKREAATVQLLAHVHEMEKLYGARSPIAVAIAGDWNTTLDADPRFAREKTIRALIASGYRSTWEGVPFENRITHPGAGGYPPITFDHVLLKGFPQLRASVVEESGISDHNPVRLALLPTGGSDPVPEPSATPSATPTPTPQHEAGQQGFGFRSFTPNMNGYSEIPGMPKPTPKPTTTPLPTDAGFETHG